MADVLPPRRQVRRGPHRRRRLRPIGRGKAAMTGLAMVVSGYFAGGALTGCTEPHVTIAVP